MRFKSVYVILVVFILLMCGCSGNKEPAQGTNVPTLGEKNVMVTATDIEGNYSFPSFKNMKSEAVQTQINESVKSFALNEVKARKSTAVQLLSGTDVSDHAFYEYGTYKVYCNDGKYLSFYLTMEQRFTKKDKTEFVKQNFVYNYDAVTGKKIDISSLFRSEKEVSKYIAEKLYERLLSMECLSSDVYSDAVFRDNILDYCAIISENKVAVVTTSGKFNLKLSAGAPCVEISIPEEYCLKSN